MRVRNGVLLGVVALVALGAALIGQPAITQLAPFKVAIVDTERVFNEYEETKAAQAQIDKAIDRLETEAKALDSEVRSLEDKLTKQRLFIEDENKVRQMEQEIRDKKQELQNMVELGQQALADKEQELTEPILKRIRETIRTYGEDNAFDLIQERRLVVLYHRPDMDITDEIIQLLNAAAASPDNGRDGAVENDETAQNDDE